MGQPTPKPVTVGTAAELANYRPSAGELTHESDTGAFKTGDGATLHSALAASGGGTSVAGATTIKSCAFAFDTPGLAAGIEVYTPAIGDVLLDAWIEITQAWNGTTPKFDVGFFASPGDNGWFGWYVNPLDLTVADNEGNVGPAGLLAQPSRGRHDGNTPTTLLSQTLNEGWGSTDIFVDPTHYQNTTRNLQQARFLPARFTVDSPIKVCVTQNGTPSGADPAATQGAAVLYLVISTPDPQ